MTIFSILHCEIRKIIRSNVLASMGFAPISPGQSQGYSKAPVFLI